MEKRAWCLWRVARILALCGLLLLAGLAPAARAESDGFISDAGVFSYLSSPSYLPWIDVAPSDGWIGLFYAEGVGLEVRIWGESSDAECLYCDLYNYNVIDGSPGMAYGATLQRGDDGALTDVDGRFSLRDLHDGTFTMDLSPDYLAQMKEKYYIDIYGDRTSAEFTDASILLGRAVEDRWGGAYFHDVMTEAYGTQVYDDMTLYVSLVQLYGTRDYYMVHQAESCGAEVDAMNFEFLTESEGALIHDYGVSVVTGKNYTVHYVMDENRTLHCDAGDDGTITDYIRCSSKTMWGD